MKEYAIYRIYWAKTDQFMGKPWLRLSHLKSWLKHRGYKTIDEIPDDWIVYDLNSIHGLSTYPVKDIMK